jgi:hypothetical protein
MVAAGPPNRTGPNAALAAGPSRRMAASRVGRNGKAWRERRSGDAFLRLALGIHQRRCSKVPAHAITLIVVAPSQRRLAEQGSDR